MSHFENLQKCEEILRDIWHTKYGLNYDPCYLIALKNKPKIGHLLMY